MMKSHGTSMMLWSYVNSWDIIMDVSTQFDTHDR